MVRSSGEGNSHGSPLQPVMVGTRTLHGKDAHDILQANAGRTSHRLFCDNICRKTRLSQLYWVKELILMAAGSHSILTRCCGSSGQRLESSGRDFPVSAGELPVETECPALSPSCCDSLQVLSADPLLHQASCPSYPQWESLLYNLAVLQASCLCSLIACLLLCFWCNTLTPADSMGGKGRHRNLVAFAVFPDMRIPKHFFPHVEQA